MNFGHQAYFWDRLHMSKIFAQIFALLTALEREYGIALLEKDERAIFDFIVIALSKGQDITGADIVDAKLTSRSSTYRHLTSLREAGLISEVVKDGRPVIVIDAKFDQFKKSLDRITRKISRIG